MPSGADAYRRIPVYNLLSSVTDYRPLGIIAVVEDDTRTNCFLPQAASTCFAQLNIEGWNDPHCSVELKDWIDDDFCRRFPSITTEFLHVFLAKIGFGSSPIDTAVAAFPGYTLKAFAVAPNKKCRRQALAVALLVGYSIHFSCASPELVAATKLFHVYVAEELAARQRMQDRKPLALTESTSKTPPWREKHSSTATSTSMRPRLLAPPPPLHSCYSEADYGRNVEERTQIGHEPEVRTFSASTMEAPLTEDIHALMTSCSSIVDRFFSRRLRQDLHESSNGHICTRQVAWHTQDRLYACCTRCDTKLDVLVLACKVCGRHPEHLVASDAAHDDVRAHKRTRTGRSSRSTSPSTVPPCRSTRHRA